MHGMVSLKVFFFIRWEPEHIPHFRYLEFRLEHISTERHFRSGICFSYFSPEYVLYLAECRSWRDHDRIRICEAKCERDPCRYRGLSYSETWFHCDALMGKYSTYDFILFWPVPSSEYRVQKNDWIFLYCFLEFLHAYCSHKRKISLFRE